MSDGLVMASEEYRTVGGVDAARMQSLCHEMGTVQGVERLQIQADGTVHVEYYPDIISRRAVLKELDRLGLTRQAGRTAGPLARFLHRMEKSNAETFGCQPLDCCELNRKTGA